MSLARYFDHTLLQPDLLEADLKRHCEEAKRYGFAAVCIPPYFIKKVVSYLEESPVKVCSVVGFPMGYTSTPAKVEEIKRAIEDGADEIDVVVNIAAVKNGHWNYVRSEIDSLTTAVQMKRKVIKVILETGLLDSDSIEKLCEICKECGPDFVKTSTGFNGEGATVAVVRQLRSLLPDTIKVKASGGIRTSEDAKRLIDAGAGRLGSSTSLLIMKE